MDVLIVLSERVTADDHTIPLRIQSCHHGHASNSPLNRSSVPQAEPAVRFARSGIYSTILDPPVILDALESRIAVVVMMA